MQIYNTYSIHTDHSLFQNEKSRNVNNPKLSKFDVKYIQKLPIHRPANYA